ncbi:hypothetical protein FIBSPDRAFT_508467 [Athelia psychrophila]|uniref:Uncharacterized protein n=1 Tax=Athelia psychrophila TaxID=1759441 RepID=A0A166JWE3_9AGAM|nr:hypothetical protein FIBSPDRAFT_508467 [Fibularhizoctonia sp. CBS 109695]
MCGLPYLALGTKLAFIEAIAGFAPMAFPGVLFRRILRFCGRTALVWGGIRGLDWEEDFRGQGGLAQVLKGNGMARIGLPRALSPQEDKKGLLRPLSPTIRYQGRVIGHPYASRDSHTPAVPPGALVDSGSVPLRRGRAGERVTVHYQQGYAPHLEMRLSGLGVPDTGTLVRNIKEQGLLDDVWDQSEGMERKKSIREMRQERKQKERELDQISQVSGLRVYSISSEDWNIVRFSTPPNTSPFPIRIPPPVAVQRAATTISNSSSLRRKPVPALLSPLPRHVGIRYSNGSGLPSPMTAASQASFASGGTYQTQGSGDWLATASKGRYAAATYRTTGVSHASLPMPPPSAVGGLQGNPFSPGPGSTGDVDNYNENSHYLRESDGSALSATHAAEIVKIKAIGTAPHKVTPPPTRVGFWRSSVEIERGVTPSRLSSSEDEADEVDGGEGSIRKDVDFGVGSPMLGHAV